MDHYFRRLVEENAGDKEKKINYQREPATLDAVTLRKVFGDALTEKEIVSILSLSEK